MKGLISSSTVFPKRTVMPIGMGTRPHENGELGWIGRSCRGYFQRKPIPKTKFPGPSPKPRTNPSACHKSRRAPLHRQPRHSRRTNPSVRLRSLAKIRRRSVVKVLINVAVFNAGMSVTPMDRLIAAPVISSARLPAWPRFAMIGGNALG